MTTTTFPSDAFVALPPAAAADRTIFAKNSGRPANEVQEVIYVPASDHAAGSKIKVSDNPSFSIIDNPEQ